MKFFLPFLLAIPAVGQVLFFASSDPKVEIATAANGAKASVAVLSAPANQVTFSTSTNDDYFYIAVLANKPTPKFMLGQFQVPMATKDEGYPRKITHGGKEYTIYRSYYQIGGAKTLIVLK